MKRTLAAALLFLYVAGARSAHADDAQQVFDSLYGAKIKAAAGTIDRADDVALAKDLLAAARSSSDTPALLALMCDAAYDLGQRHADGYATAAEAMTLLAETVEAKRAAAREKLVEMLTKQSRLGKPDERDAATEKLIDTLLAMGDEKMEAKQWSEAAGDYRRAMLTAAPKKLPQAEEAKAKVELAMRRDRSAKQITRLTEKLQADANDSASAEEIVKLYVVEFDDPQAALPFLNRVKDDQLKKLVPLAADAIGDLKGDETLELGEWYNSLAGTLPDKASMLLHAKECLAAYLEGSAGSDLSRRKASVMLAAINKELEQEGKDDPKKWFVLFRSSEAKYWDEEVNERDAFAVKLNKAPQMMRYLRMRRTDNNDIVIIPLAAPSLGGKAEGETWVWNGKRGFFPKSVQFGLGIKGLKAAPGDTWIDVAGLGYGFGHVISRGGQAWGWAGKTTNKITIEISVTASALSATEKAKVLK